MKRKYFSILLAAMTIAASANVYAAPLKMRYPIRKK